MIVIRPASAGDLPPILAIQNASLDAAHWDVASYLNYDCLVATVDEKVVAFLVTRETTPGEREILNLAVHPDRRRQGIARSLIREVLDRSNAVWFLEVRASNEAALNLYKGLGFEPAGRRENYYVNPSEAAIVMRNFSWYCHGAVGHR
jgi:ribosomal-protein-alanine acetyltransferase